MPRLILAWFLTLFVLWLFSPWLGRLGLFRLPGDLRLQRPSGNVIHIPISTSLLVAVVVSIVLWVSN